MNIILRKEKNADFGIGIEGDQSFSLVDRSLASYLANLLKGKNFFESKKSYPLPNKYGDFSFRNITVNITILVMNMGVFIGKILKF